MGHSMATGVDIQASPQAYPSVEELLARITPPLSEKHAQYIRAAYALGEKAHAGQTRESGKPYFSHCVQVAMLLADLVSDWATLAAGLLHDTIEDCGLTPDDIRAACPDPVAELVDGVTKIGAIHFISDQEHQASNLRKMILAMARDVRVVLIKLCDRLHNMRTLEYLDVEKQRRIATVTSEIYAPLAKRLGIEKISRELEDLTMRYLQPVLYRRLNEHLERNKDRYLETIRKTREQLDDALVAAGVQARVSGRLKHIFSLFDKMRKNALELDEIHDLIAIRVICENVGDCYSVLGIVHTRWKPLEGRFKDYIGTPKPNGYRSIHTTVIGPDGEICEIQIRTREMHEAAEEGVAAHWRYKEAGSSKSLAAQEAENVAWLRQLIDWLSDIRDPDEFMAAVKQDVYEASVFCYTPKGDVIELHKGSTVLDFAYRIHTEVGNHCAGARVNHKMASLRTVLNTGDIVEILTSKTAHPTRDWPRIAGTNRARNKIRHWLKTHDRDYYIERGRSILMDELRPKLPAFNEGRVLERLDQLAPQFQLGGAEDVLVELGFGTIKTGSIVSRLIESDGAAPAVIKPPRKPDLRARKPGEILVEGIPGALTRLAQCCNPQPGDPILGFVTQTRGISIHHRNCPSFAHTREVKANANRRIVAVEWADGSEPRMKVAVRVLCQDRQGLLNDITRAVSNFDVSIIQTNSQSNLRTSRAIIKMTLLVAGEEDLNNLLRRIEEVPSVISVSRVVHTR
jgi:GTP diphosphokinase / guanosine-3',5'-bis(diphosphate) 3'-diphosphatase